MRARLELVLDDMGSGYGLYLWEGGYELEIVGNVRGSNVRLGCYSVRGESVRISFELEGYVERDVLHLVVVESTVSVLMREMVILTRVTQ